jgi:hypothetical protein
MASRDELLQQLQELKTMRAQLDEPEVAAPQQPQGFMAGLSGEGGKGLMAEVGEGFSNMWSGLSDLGQRVSQNPLPAGLGLPAEIAKGIFSGVDSLEGGIDRVGKTASYAIPVIGPAAYEMVKDVALGEEQPAYEYGQMFRKGVTELPAQITTALAPNIVKGGYNATVGGLQRGGDFLFGKPEKVLLQEQATRPDAFASQLNYPSRRTPGERIVTENAAELSPVFQRTNPVAGIDKTQPGAVQISQLQDNLNNIETSAVTTRNAILPQVAQAEQKAMAAAQQAGTPYKAGVSIDDIPPSVATQTGSYGLPQIAVRYGTEAVTKAQQFMQQLFGMETEFPYGNYPGAPSRLSQSRSLSVEEANLARQKIDGMISEIGGFDDSYWASSSVNPSVMKGYAEALRFYRNQLDGVIKGKISKLLGQDVADQFTQAGEAYSMAQTYRPMVQRFQTETAEAFAPGSAKAVPPGQGPLGTGGMMGQVSEAVAPTRANRMMREKALSRESNAIDSLQRLVELKNAGYQQPLPRSTARIIASMPNLQTFAGLATKLGIINASIDITKLPEPVLEKMVAAVAQAAPEMFETNPDNVNVVNGKLQNPMEVDMLKAQAVERPTIERAEAMMSLNRRDYKPFPGTTVSSAPTPKPSTLPDLRQLTSLLEPDTQGASFMPPTDADDMVAKLERMTAIHEQDIQ